jgi:hypothetical protein
MRERTRDKTSRREAGEVIVAGRGRHPQVDLESVGGVSRDMKPYRWPRNPSAGFPYLLAALTIVAVVACRDAISPEAAAAPGDISVSSDRLRAHVSALAHDSTCGRRAGTVYEDRAASYVERAFVQAGLVEAGSAGYRQPFPLGAQAPDLPVASATCASQPVLTSQNVIGAIPGAGALQNEWVVLGAHYDHLGWEVSDGVTSVFNGADDNASGTAVVIEVGRLLAAWLAAHPDAANRRSILIETFGAEEEGLIGSRHFATSPTVPGSSMYAMVNLDMVGRLRDGTLTVGGASTATAWPTLLEQARPSGIQLVYSDAALQRSDQWSFIAFLDVPAVHFFTGLHPDYHQPTDDVAEIQFDGMQRVARLTLGVVWALATRTSPL